MIKLTVIDGIHYIRCGDLDRLLKQIRRAVYNQYERDENGVFFQPDGTKGITKEDAAALATTTHTMTRVMEQEVRKCESADDIRNLHKRIAGEAYIGRYVITASDVVKKKIFVFVMFSKQSMIKELKEQGKTMDEIEEELEDVTGEPIFSENWIDACFFETYEDAQSVAELINETYEMKGMTAKVEPAMHINRMAMDDLLKDIFKKSEEKTKHE